MNRSVPNGSPYTYEGVPSGSQFTDSLVELHAWREVYTLLTLCRVVTLARALAAEGVVGDLAKPATLDWMKAEGAYTRRVMDAIAPLAALQKRVSAFTGSFGFVQGFVSYGGRVHPFWQRFSSGHDSHERLRGTPRL